MVGELKQRLSFKNVGERRADRQSANDPFADGPQFQIGGSRRVAVKRFDGDVVGIVVLGGEDAAVIAAEQHDRVSRLDRSALILDDQRIAEGVGMVLRSITFDLVVLEDLLERAPGMLIAAVVVDIAVDRIDIMDGAMREPRSKK
jgi:hypothetical protein